jgi:hypothetical protein
MKIRRSPMLVAPLAAALPSLFFGFALAGCATDRQVVAQAEQENHELEPAVIKDSEITAYLN